MSFQKTVNRTMAPGLPGSNYGTAPSVETAYMAAVDLIPGTFVCNLAGGASSAQNPKQAGYKTGGIPVGLVTRDTTGYIPSVLTEYSNIINAGLNVQVASKGEFMIHLDEVAAGTANIGMQIAVADPTTGVPSAVADGTAGALDWWIVDILDAASGLCAISSWRKG